MTLFFSSQGSHSADVLLLKRFVNVPETHAVAWKLLFQYFVSGTLYRQCHPPFLVQQASQHQLSLPWASMYGLKFLLLTARTISV